MLIEINEQNIDFRLIDQVVEALRAGELIIYPTDTVYAMGCDLKNKKALENLAKLKNMKLSKSMFSIICKDLSQVSDYVKHIDRPTFKLLKQSLPGPFTFILDANNELPKYFDSKRKEIGIKIPANQIVLAIVERLGHPLVTTSLIDDEDELLEYFIDPYEIYQRFDEKVHTIIDGGYGKLEGSTIVSCTGGAIEVLRQGAGEVF
jgi:tRNA threonylcarbamoyl adenosine modification protein (Sua5/YciO/YrdC/YwlC family)